MRAEEAAGSIAEEWGYGAGEQVACITGVAMHPSLGISGESACGHGSLISKSVFVTEGELARRRGLERAVRLATVAAIGAAAAGACLYLLNQLLVLRSDSMLVEGLPPVQPAALSGARNPKNDAHASFDNTGLAEAAGEEVAVAPASAPPVKVTATPMPEQREVLAETKPDDAPPVVPAGLRGSEIRIVKRSAEAGIQQRLEAALAAYTQGRNKHAEFHFREVLGAEPNHRRARAGLAAVRAREGKSAQAFELYRELLRENPREALALSGLVELDGTGVVRAVEKELRRLAAAHPADAVFQHALGSFFARQHRWEEARAAYLRAIDLEDRHAVRPEEKNPAYTFNLAVAFDRLGQRTGAAKHYRQALELDRHRPGHFDALAARQRLAEIGNRGARP